MRSIFATLALTILIFVCSGYECVAQAIPNPVIYMIGQEQFSTGGKDFVRYRYGVDNSASFPNALFAPAPSLPPCGSNNNSSRTWVDVFDQRGRRLNGFCAFGKSEDLNSIWFAMPVDEVPPSWIYIELNDRQTTAKYKSNLAETTN